ncbi:2334_t:CDS:10 [Funneliformis geosporum]|uniref:Conserved oligomeric Golgi complex subunit 4 n=1 Tax=Funneliformis geosporum TaxID=1117311 RepID=A0A9W4WYV4_9GLOM|nr:2334_t:CDS:10 [Funneliformis geosporum]CAI2173814.1 5864_t:CDS:10 [Funneliformis geosporum]
MPGTTKPQKNITNPSELSLTYLKSLTNIEDIQECLRLLDLEENQIDLNLDELLESRPKLESELDKLEILRPQLGTLHTQAANLLNIINGTSSVAERISAQVRQLDLEQIRVQESIKQVEDVQELKLCITGIHQALYMKDYETAASYVNRVSTLDKTILDGEFAEISVPSSDYPDIPTKTLHDAKESLFAIFSREFETAVNNRDQENISRFFKLFPLIGKETEGLDKYSKFVCGIIAGKSQANLAEIAVGTNFYGNALTKLFENIALIIDQHQSAVETHYGPGKMIRVVERLQEECDKQSRIILNTFYDERQIQRKVLDIQIYNDTPKKASSSQRSGQSREFDNIPDPRELDVALSELAMISARTHLYYRFMESRAKLEVKAMQVNGTDVSLLEKDADKYDASVIIKTSGLSKQIKMLMKDFIVLEEYFFRKAIEKAMKIDNYEEGSTSSSCVEDVFYILKECLSRAVTTSDVDCLTSIVNLVNQSLEVDYLALFQKRLLTAFATSEPKDARIGYMILLNNLDVSCDYMQRLTSELVMIPSIMEENYEKIQKSFTWLNNTTTNKFKQLLHSGLEQLFTQMVKPRIRPILQEAYKDIKYVLDEDEYHEQEANDNFTKRFVAGFDNLIKIYQITFTSNNFNQIMMHILESVTNMWEKTVFGTKFNQYGALRFDKDLRSVSNYFSVKMQWPIRDKFTRLNQISTLLNLESLSEIHDYWGSTTKATSPITWRLTVNEAKKIVGLRIDFNAEEVSKLKL